MKTVDTNTTDQSIRFWAYDSDGAAVTGESHNSAGMAVSVVVRRKGRIASTTSLTLVARSGAGVHTDSALTEVGSGEYVVDLPDSYLTTAGDHVSLTVASTAITGTVVVESLTAADAFPTVAEFNARTLPSDDYFVVGDYHTPEAMAMAIAGSVADAVWDEAQATHVVAGTFGAVVGATIPELISTLRGTDSDTLKTLSDQIDDIAGATFDTAMDSLEAIRDRGDAAWISGASGSVTVGSLTQAALAQFVTDNTGETAASPGSVALISQGDAAGAGTFRVPLTIKLTAGPLVTSCDCIVTSTDTSPSTNIVASVVSDPTTAVAVFFLDAGTYYLWLQKAGVNFTNPRTLTIASDGTATVT